MSEALCSLSHRLGVIGVWKIVLADKLIHLRGSRAKRDGPPPGGNGAERSGNLAGVKARG